MNTPAPASSALVRIARPLFIGHVALILFSTIALVTILAGPPPEWLQEGINLTIYRLGWRYSGPLYVVLGALAALAHAAGVLGTRRAIGLLLAASVVALGAELLGTSTGFPFGPYSYTPLLGYRILGLVPFPIPISWFYMLYGSLAICGRLLPARDGLRTKLLWAAVAAVVLTAWDVAMDPAMVKTAHWVWHQPGPFYGMPWSNFAGWLLTGFVIAMLMLWIAPPSRISTHVSPTLLPIGLYAVNGIMPVAICIRDEMWWAAILGTLAMAIPVALALRAGAPGSLRSRERERPMHVVASRG